MLDVDALLLVTAPQSLAVISRRQASWTTAVNFFPPTPSLLSPFDISRFAVWLTDGAFAGQPAIFFQATPDDWYLPAKGGSAVLGLGDGQPARQLAVEYLAPFEGLDQLTLVPECPGLAVGIGRFDSIAGSVPRLPQSVMFSADGWRTNELAASPDLRTLAAIPSRLGTLLVAIGREDGREVLVLGTWASCDALTWRSQVDVPIGFQNGGPIGGSARTEITFSLTPLRAQGEDLARFMAYNGDDVALFVVSDDGSWRMTVEIVRPQSL
jgi:hypothetical protein